MGLFDSSSNSKTNSSAVNSGFSDINGNANVQSLQGVSVSGKNASSNITVTDNGAVKNALNFADKAASNVFDFATQTQSQAYDFSKDVNRSTANTVGAAIDAVSASARTETENIFINLQKYALYGAIIWGVVKVFGSKK